MNLILSQNPALAAATPGAEASRRRRSLISRIRLGCLYLLLMAMLAPATIAAESPRFKVGVFDNSPIVFQQEPGRYAGLSVEFLDSVAASESLTFDYVYGTWKDVLSQLETGEIDLLVGIAYTAERAQQFDFTTQTLINNWGVVYRNPSVSITSLADLQGKRVAMMARSIHSRVFRQLMDEFGFEFEPVEVSSYLDALAAAEAGDADAAVINRVISLLNGAQYDVIETGVMFNPVEVRFASPKGRHAALLATIDRHLTAQKQDPASAYHRSLAKWFSATGRAELPTWLVYLGAMIAGLLVVLTLTNHLIRRKVVQRTQELTDSELRFRQLAENINEVFWIGSPDWNAVHYVSPAYERVWGRKCEELYADPLAWLESVHPDDKEQVRSDIERKVSGDLSDPAFREYRVISAAGDTHWIFARAYPIVDEQGKVVKIAGIAEDITSRKRAEEKINFMAMHDPLTRMLNRFAFERELVQLIKDKPSTQARHALLYIDLDQFKVVNDTCGHTAGDKMLIRLAGLLQDAVDPHGVIARLGGDEFGVILRNISLERADALAQQLLELIKGFRFVWAEQRFSVGASIGLVMLEDDHLSELDLLSAADMACYAAKERGRNRIHIYSHDDVELVRRHGEMQWVGRINHALEEDRFVLHRQCIAPLSDGSADSACHEYLLRLFDEQGALIYPDAFLPAAERFELMSRLDRWVVGRVFEFLHQDRDDRASARAGILAFINLSGQVFTDDGFVDFVIGESRRHGVEPASICFEITETVAIGNIEVANRFIRQLTECGFKFALDDFGTGMSSFSYLKSLQVDFVKIDGVFIKDLFGDPMNAAMVEAITHVAHTADLKVIAEWVETADAVDRLKAMGVDYAQGYAIERPAALPDMPGLDAVRSN